MHTVICHNVCLDKIHIFIYKYNIARASPVPHSKSGIVPRSALLGAGHLGFWEVGKGGTVG